MGGRHNNRPVYRRRHFNAEEFQNQNFPRVLFGKREAGKRKRLGGFRLLTPHAPSGVRTQPAVEITSKRACVLYAAIDKNEIGQLISDRFLVVTIYFPVFTY